QRVAGGPEAAISRRHALLDHGKLNGAEGVFSVVGGKLSTFRPLARETVERLAPPRSRTNAAPPDTWRDDLRGTSLPIEFQRHLRIYGAAIPAVVRSGADVICPQT